MLLVVLRRRVGRLDLTATIRSFVLARRRRGALAVVVVRGLVGARRALGRSFAAQVVSLGTALVVGSGVYLAACRALRVPEMATLLSLRDRFRRA